MDRKGITGAGIAVHHVCNDGHGLARIFHGISRSKGLTSQRVCNILIFNTLRQYGLSP